MQREHLPCFTRCSLRVHRLSSINFIFCVHVHMCITVHADINSTLGIQSWEKEVKIFFILLLTNTVNIMYYHSDTSPCYCCTVRAAQCSACFWAFWMQSWLIVRRGKKERMVNDRHVSRQYLDLQFDYISGLVYDTLYFRKLLSYTGNFELADLVAKLIRILKEGVCVFLFWGFFLFWDPQHRASKCK